MSLCIINNMIVIIIIDSFDDGVSFGNFMYPSYKYVKILLEANCKFISYSRSGYLDLYCNELSSYINFYVFNTFSEIV